MSPTSAQRLGRLTPALTALLPILRDEWLAHGLSTAPAERPRAEAGIDAAYRAAGLAPPTRKTWCTSPLAAALTRALLAELAKRAGEGDSVWDSVWASVRASVRASVGASVGGSVWDSVGASVRASVGASVGASVRASVWASVRDSVGDSVRASVGGSVWDSVGASVRASVRDSVYGAVYGQHEAGWFAFYDFFARAGLEERVRPLTGLMETGRSMGWWWPLQGLALCSERHCELHRDDQGRLHSTQGMALRYPDGWGVYAVHGVRVPERVVMQPQSLTPQEIRDERNVELRRVMLERYGADRFIRKIGARLVGRDDWGELFRAELPEDEDLAMVHVVNSTPEPDGSFRDYWLRVPPAMRTAREAVAWTFGETPERYAPEAQT